MGQTFDFEDIIVTSLQYRDKNIVVEKVYANEPQLLPPCAYLNYNWGPFNHLNSLTCK